MERPWCRFPEEKHEPVSDIDTVEVDSLKALDPKGPIREGDILLELTKKAASVGGPVTCVRAATAASGSVELASFYSGAHQTSPRHCAGKRGIPST